MRMVTCGAIIMRVRIFVMMFTVAMRGVLNMLGLTVSVRPRDWRDLE